MSGRDRRPHETATVLDQSFLDYSQDNLEQKLQLIVDIESDQRRERRVSCTISLASPAIVSAVDHRILTDQPIIFETDGTLLTPLVAGTTYYAKAVTATSFQISATPGGASINTSGTQSGNHTVSFAAGLTRISDRNIFVGSRFYEARTKFPVVNRTLGEWLRPQIEFSSISFSVNNVDGEYNNILPAGEFYSGQINKEIDLKLGIRDVESTYFSIFKGFVSDVGGFKRDIDAFSYVARDKFDRLNVNFPPTVFTDSSYSKLSNGMIGKGIPIIYGDYTTEVDAPGNVPSFVVNGKDPRIFKLREFPIEQIDSTTLELDGFIFTLNDKVRFTTDGTLPSPLALGTDYYVLPTTGYQFEVSATPSGGAITLSGGSGQHNIIPQDLVNLNCVIAGNVLTQFDNADVWVLRGDSYWLINSLDITSIAGDLNAFEIISDSGNTLIDGANYTYEDSDQFFCKVKGKDLGAYDDNPVQQARDILLTYAGASATDFDPNWDTYRDKSTPSQSAIVNIKSRIWKQESGSVLDYALSILEQVRLEFAISKDLTLKINSLHFEDWPVNPSFRLRNFDIELNSTKVSVDEKNNFNRASGFYAYNPVTNENSKQTAIYRNQAAISQVAGKQISKAVEFPNLYILSDVENQIQEILKLAGYSEFVSTIATTRALLLDLGDFIKMNVQIGSTIWEDIPMMVREIGYDPELKLHFKFWSMQMIPYANPSGWNPGYEGIVGGDTATITKEV